MTKTDERHELARRDELDVMTLGEILVKSGFFRDTTQHAQAVVKVLAGRELGLQPIAAMTGIHIVEGKPTLGANLYAAFIRKHPVYDYRVIEATREVCALEFRRGKGKDAEILGVYRMTLKQAAEAGLTQGKNGPKHNWKAHPDAMLFARCVSQGARFYCPDVFEGHTVYTPDELGAREEEPAAPPAQAKEPTKVVDAEVVGKVETPAPNQARADAIAEKIRERLLELGDGQGAAARAYLDKHRSDPAKLEALLSRVDELVKAKGEKAAAEKPAERQPAYPRPADPTPAGAAAPGAPAASPPKSAPASSGSTSSSGGSPRPGPGATASSSPTGASRSAAAVAAGVGEREPGADEDELPELPEGA